MNLSSILIFTSPAAVPDLRDSLNALPGIEVHYQCLDSGRLVVIQEADDDDAEMNGLRCIKNLPQVMAAEMVYHYVDNDAAQNGAGEALSWA